MSRIPLPADKEAQRRRNLNLAIAEIDGLSVRTVNALEDHLGLIWVHQLVRRTEVELLAVPNFGTATLQEVRRALAPLGLSLRGV